MTTNELINENMGLIKKIASKFYGSDLEDLIQVGVIIKKWGKQNLVLMLIHIYLERCMSM